MRETLKLALEALETGLCYVENEDFDNKQKFRGYEHLMPTDAAESIQEIKTAITAIKEALAQPEQEPVAWMRDDEMKAMVSDEKRAWILCGRSELIEEYNKPLYTNPPQPKEPEQEPVAMQMDVIVVNLVREGINKHRARELAEHFIKHTTPPQRTWVGLTPEEVEACIHHVDEDGIGLFDFAEAIEAKLKEKNA